jgi:glycosyltransferase involved in cell wall biosynthesis
MRVLCFGRFFDDIPGGMQTHVEHLFESLKGRVDFVHLVPSRDASSSASTVKGFPLYRTASWNIDGSLALSPGLLTMARHLHRERPFDLIHLHFPDPVSHLASLVLPKSIPRVITWHADITRQKILRTLYAPLQNHALRHSARIIVYTPAHISSSLYLPAIDSQTFSIIPYGFDLQPYQLPHSLAPEIRKKFGSKIIFALGRHVYYKGFDYLISAMEQLPEDTQLLIGGEGPLTDQWKGLARLSPAANRIHFLGLIPQADIAAYFQACNVFCLPAINQAEAFGAVQVEAMACGKPVVSTRLNNGVDFVNQHGVTGLTVPVADVPALAQALSQILNDPELAKDLSEQALQRAIQEFSLSAMGEKTFAAYQQALKYSTKC